MPITLLTCKNVRTGVRQSQRGAVTVVAAQRSDSAHSASRPSRRDLLLAGLCSVALAMTPAAASVAAEQLAVPSTTAAAAVQEQGAAAAAAAAAASTAPSAVTPVYFGNGCFWGRQYEFVNTEKLLGRSADQITSLVGYAGGEQGEGGKVCYYYAPEVSVYEKLGHAEVVQVEVHGTGDAAQQQFRAFADTYFSQFRKTPFGMMRLDPQDMGPGYRNVIGIPGGIKNAELMKVLQEANVNRMRLVEGQGNEYSPEGQHPEGDAFNTVFILDSTARPFFRAEQYHQFHNGIGEAFPPEYTQQLKQVAMQSGRINPTGCPEYRFASK